LPEKSFGSEITKNPVAISLLLVHLERARRSRVA